MRRRVASECSWRRHSGAYNGQPQTSPAWLTPQWALLFVRILHPNRCRRANGFGARHHRRRLQQRREEDQQGCHARQHVFKVARHPMLH